ncbi:hypothetical protein ACMWPE_24755, partial [Escherichia coli]
RFVDGRQVWMLATGTGLGPYVAILQQPEVWQRFSDLVVVHGVRQREELAYAETFARLQQQARAQGWPARLQLLRCVTRDAALPD